MGTVVVRHIPVLPPARATVVRVCHPGTHIRARTAACHSDVRRCPHRQTTPPNSADSAARRLEARECPRPCHEREAARGRGASRTLLPRRARPWRSVRAARRLIGRGKINWEARSAGEHEGAGREGRRAARRCAVCGRRVACVVVVRRRPMAASASLLHPSAWGSPLARVAARAGIRGRPSPAGQWCCGSPDLVAGALETAHARRCTQVHARHENWSGSAGAKTDLFCRTHDVCIGGSGCGAFFGEEWAGATDDVGRRIQAHTPSPTPRGCDDGMNPGREK